MQSLFEHKVLFYGIAATYTVCTLAAFGFEPLSEILQLVPPPSDDVNSSSLSLLDLSSFC